jgi:hypothetical protein
MVGLALGCQEKFKLELYTFCNMKRQIGKHFWKAAEQSALCIRKNRNLGTEFPDAVSMKDGKVPAPPTNLCKK